MAFDLELQPLVRSVDDIVLVATLDGKILHANPVFGRELGFDPEDRVGMRLLDLYPPDHRQEAREFVEATLRGELGSIALPVLVGDGSTRRMLTRILIGRWDDAECLLVLITEQNEEMSQLFERVFRGSPILMAISSDDQRFVDVNDTWLETLGFGREEVLGRTPAELDLFPSPEQQIAVGKELASTGRINEVEMKIRRRDGTIIDGVFSGESIISRGKPFFFTVMVDITERKHAEEARRRSEAFLDGVVEHLPAMIFIKDAEDLRFVRFNREGENLLGYSREELVGKSDEDFFPPDEARFFTEKDREVLASGEMLDIPEEPIQTLRRGERILHTRKIPMLDQDGRPEFLLGFSVDITEQKRAEEALKRSEALLRESQRIAGIGSWELDLVNDRLVWSEEVYRLFGLDPNEHPATYKAFLDQVHPDDRDKVDTAYSSSLLEGRHSYEVEHRIVHKGTGEVRWVHEKCAHDRDEQGNAIRSVGTVHDITESRQLEEELRKTQKLESIGTLAGGLAHDFNNLLQGVFGQLSLARMNAHDPQQCMADLAQAEEALGLATKLTNQLLTFAKGGQPIRKPVDLRLLVEKAAGFALSGSQIDSRIEVDEDLWLVDADEGQISQAVQNMVMNADQAMPIGDTINIELRNVSSPGADLPMNLEPGRYVAVSIVDSGIGIPSQYLSKIFDPYFTTKEKGSGLGLATSYSIVKYHGGLLDVESELGRGTTIRFFLPRSESEIADLPEHQAPALDDEARVLVMDDEAMILGVAVPHARDAGA